MHVQSCCFALSSYCLFDFLVAARISSPVQTDATLLANNSQHCWMLHIASVCTPCFMLLDVAACCCAKFETSQTCQPTTPNIFFFCSVIAEAYCNNVGSVCAALPTLLGPRTLITHGLQRLMGCILPTMHCRSQHCWELLHPFAHHCQHTRNNSQHCWRNNVESCCTRLHAALLLCKLSFAPVIAHQRLIHPLQYNEECIFCATGHSISDEPTWRITNTANTNRQ